MVRFGALTSSIATRHVGRNSILCRRVGLGCEPLLAPLALRVVSGLSRCSLVFVPRGRGSRIRALVPGAPYATTLSTTRTPPLGCTALVLILDVRVHAHQALVVLRIAELLAELLCYACRACWAVIRYGFAGTPGLTLPTGPSALGGA